MREIDKLPRIYGIKWIPIATEEFGWNVKHNRPATRREIYYNPAEVCMCDFCATEPHYGSHYCKRYNKDNSRFYSDHVSRWK